MTLSTTVNVKTYTGDNSTVAFSFPYLFYANDDLTVTVDGVVKAIDTDYTITGAENPAGGTVTFNTAPASSTSIIIKRIVDYTQETDLENFDGNPADVTEKQFDLVVMQTQQLAEQADRGIYAPTGTNLTTNEISGTINATSKLLSLSTDGPQVNDVDADDLTSLIAIEADISTVAGISANVTAVAGNSSNINTVAGISSNVTTVAGISANVTTVAGISADVTTVAGISADVTTVAGIAADVTAAANNIPLSNRTATTDPTVNDDSGDGYSAGSQWVNTSTDMVFFCADASVGAADWKQIGLADTDLISAATSAGLVLEAANGTDVANFGAGNTANATFYGNVSMNTTGKIVNMADPTSAQDAATKAYVDAEIAAIPAATSDWELIDTYTPTSVATQEIPLTGAYSSFQIVCDNMLPATDNRGLQMRLSDDGGSTFKSGTGDYAFRYNTLTGAGSLGTDTGAASTFIGIAGSNSAFTTGVGNQSDEGLSFTMDINVGGTRSNSFVYSGSFIQGAGTARQHYLFWGNGHMFDTSASPNRIQLYFNSGDIASATLTLYGKKT